MGRPWFYWLFSAVGLVVLLGLALRMREFFAFRSLWMDEIALYAQIKARSFGTMLRMGVGASQGAPAAYLVLTKFAIMNISTIEVATRIVAFVAGLGVVITTAAIAMRAFKDAPARVLACLLVATSPLLIHYSSEGKQYMLDTFVASLLILTSLRYEANRCSLTTLLLIGVVVVWFAHSAPLVLCACGIVLMAREWREGNYRQLLKLVAVAMAWIVSFAFHVSTNMRSLLSNGPLYDYWASGLAPWQEGGGAVATWAYTAWFNFVYYVFVPAGYRNGVDPRSDLGMNVWIALLVVMMLVGLVRLWRTRSVIAPYITSLFIVVYAVAVFRLSPFSSRIVLYLVPWVFFCQAAAIEAIFSAMKRSRIGAVVAGILFSLVGGVSLVGSAEGFVSPVDRYDIKGAVAYLSKERKPEEPLLYQEHDFNALALYARQYRFPWRSLVGFRWSQQSMPVNQTRLVKAIMASPTKSVWVMAAFRSSVVKDALAFMEHGCCTVVKRYDTAGSVSALVMRKDRKMLMEQEQSGKHDLEPETAPEASGDAAL